MYVCSFSHSYYRTLLRMYEGLQSSSPSVVHCVQSWIIHISHAHQLSYALYPVYQLLVDACPPKHGVHEEGEKERDKEIRRMVHAKYYYESLKQNEMKGKEKEEQKKSMYPCFLMMQLVDVARFNYAVSILRSVVCVDPVTIVTAMSGDHTLRTQKRHSTSHSVTADFTKHSSSEQQSLLESILGQCVSLLLSLYPAWLDVDKADLNSLMEVKTASAALVATLLSACIEIKSSSPIGSHSPSSGDTDKSSITTASELSFLVSSSHILAMMQHCKIQDGCLMSLFYLISTTSCQYTKEDGTENGCDVFNLFLQLLRVTYCLFVLESLCSLGTLAKRDKELSPVYACISGCPTVSQPLFHQILSFTLRSPLHNHHLALLALFRVSLPFIFNEIHQLAPLVLKLVCKNVSVMVKEIEFEGVRRAGNVNQRMVSYIQVLTSIVHYCLLGDKPCLLTPFLYYHPVDPFSTLPAPSLLSHEPVSSKGPLMSEKPTSTISWLFGGLFGTSGEKEEEVPEERERYVGLGSPAGRRILLTMPIVYRIICKLWRHCCSLSRGETGESGKVHVINDPLSKVVFSVVFICIESICSFKLLSMYLCSYGSNGVVCWLSFFFSGHVSIVVRTYWSNSHIQ